MQEMSRRNRAKPSGNASGVGQVSATLKGRVAHSENQRTPEATLVTRNAVDEQLKVRESTESKKANTGSLLAGFASAHQGDGHPLLPVWQLPESHTVMSWAITARLRTQVVVKLLVLDVLS
jgi:hypothetical protein